MPRFLAVAPHTATQEDRLLGQVAAGLVADGHAQEAVEVAVRVLAILGFAAAPAVAVRVQQLDPHLAALTVLK